MVSELAQLNILDFPPSATVQGKSNEWYTPARYIEAAREVMGTIDLDPASCELANQTVQAARFYTAKENGLEQPWFGRVWLNPPYTRTIEMKARGQSTIAKFVLKTLQEYKTGKVEQAILLVTSQIDAHWFQHLWEYPLCFVDHKIHFVMPIQRSSYSHMFGTLFVYLGSNEHKFIEIFSQFGRIARAIDTPRQQVQPLNLWEVAG